MGRRDRVLGWLFVILCVVLVLRAVRKDAGVMEMNRGFGERFLAGEDPYFDADEGKHVHGPYPPSFSWVCVPLSLLPEKLARGLWAVTQCLALLALYRLLRWRIERHFPRLVGQAPVVFAVSLLIVSRFLLRDMAAGGGNLLYATLAYGGVELALRTGRSLGAGLALGFVLAVKPNLLPLVLFLWLARRRRPALAALACALVMFWLPATVVGLRDYTGLARKWAGDVGTFAALEDLHDSSLVPEGMPPARNAMNQSLRSAVQRMSRPPGDSGAPDVSFVTLSPSTSAWIARGILALLLLACMRATWRARTDRNLWLAGLAFFPLALLASPITWKAHGVALLPFVAAVVCLARGRRWLQAVLVLFYVTTGLLSEELVGKVLKEELQALSVFTVGVVALLLAELALAGRGDPGTATE